MESETPAQELPLNSPMTEAILRRQWTVLDKDADELMACLDKSAASLIWHKCSTFEEHLVGVWTMLCAWRQPQDCCRLGLFHSAYGNSFVAMRLFNVITEREALASLIGKQAEVLVYAFCSVDRQQLETIVLDEGTIRKEGYTMKSLHTGEHILITQSEAAEMIVETMADYLDQSISWQNDLANAGGRAGWWLWPGQMAPTLRMSMVSKLAKAARMSGALKGRLPPVFNDCDTVLSEEDERKAVDMYFSAMDTRGEGTGTTEDALSAASRHNPFVGEPHIARAQLLCARGEWTQARDAAAKGLAILEANATAWDKRMSFKAWVCWARVIGLQATSHQWPQTHGGLESLGATHPSMQFRKLNTDRVLLEAPATASQQERAGEVDSTKKRRKLL